MFRHAWKMSLVAMVAGLAFTASASAGTVYQDSFSRSRYLEGSTPDVTTNGNVWQQTYGDAGVAAETYVTNGSAATHNGTVPVDGSSYLPVNGASGVTLDGTADFTLSAVITQGGQTSMGIGLNTATYHGGSMFSHSGGAVLATIEFNKDGNIFPLYGDVYKGSNFLGIPAGTPTYFEIAYDSAAEELSYTYGSTTFYTQTGVTAGEIASLNYVSINNGAYGYNTGTFDDFTLTIAGGNAAVPEPASIALMAAGGLLLLVRRRWS